MSGEQPDDHQANLHADQRVDYRAEHGDEPDDDQDGAFAAFALLSPPFASMISLSLRRLALLHRLWQAGGWGFFAKVHICPRFAMASCC